MSCYNFRNYRKNHVVNFCCFFVIYKSKKQKRKISRKNVKMTTFNEVNYALEIMSQILASFEMKKDE